MADNAEDVAEDYRQALEDLQVNSRIEIATLTNIARENAQHGFAIAEALANHIKKAPPSRTLPALYVLDSIVKNVPTPYALYFGPKLYSIFMGAYTKVDNATRRKMDEMLRTWKEPVPGSISTKPVFPPELVRPIEHALMAARNAAMAANQNSFQGQQQLMRGRPPVPNRDTPTPPTGRPYPPPQHQPHPYGGRPDVVPQPHPGPHGNGPNALPHRGTPQPVPPAGSYPPLPHHHYQQPAGPGYGAPQQPVISVEQLKEDIQRLIIAEKAEFAQDPLDASKQTKLKALLDLQTIIQTQDMPQDQLKIIKDRLAELAVKLRPPPPPAAAVPGGTVPAPVPPQPAYPGVPPPYSTSSAPAPVVPPSAAAVVAAALGRPPSAAAATNLPAAPSAAGAGARNTPPPAAVAAAAPPPPAAAAAAAAAGGGGKVTLDSLFGQGAFATLLSATRNSATPPAVVPPPPPPPPPVTGQPQQVPQFPGLGPNAAAAIAAALRQQQQQQQQVPPPPPPAVVPQSTTTPAPAATPAAATDPSALLAMLRQSGLLKPAGTPTPPPPAAAAVADTGVPTLDTASLKIFRPHLIPQLYEELGPPCTQCGRRFKTDEEGRRRKTAHMDWHFRVHQRLVEAERRGQWRSWCVDEGDWIRSREAIDEDYTHPTTTGMGTNPAANTGSTGSDSSSSPTYDPFSAPYSNPLPSNSSSSTSQASSTLLPGGAAGRASTPTVSSSTSSSSRHHQQQVRYIPVPEDSSRVNSACPICLEKFEMKWLDDAQEWVWMDAVRPEGAGGRVFHWSCHREAYGGGNGNGSVLGKRKAEDDVGGLKGRIKTEGY